LKRAEFACSISHNDRVWDEDRLEAYEYRKALEADWEAEAQLAMDESEATSESKRKD
jgi:hypothetical protein